MTATLTRQRCWVHLEREAAARCPSCARFYCRECVTEHAGRVICAACLRDLLAAAAAKRRRTGAGARRVLAVFTRGAQLAFSVTLTWFFFHLLGHWLLAGTAQFHEATLWKEQLFGEGGGADDTDADNNEIPVKTDQPGDGGKPGPTTPGGKTPGR